VRPYVESVAAMYRVGLLLRPYVELVAAIYRVSLLLTCKVSRRDM